MSASKLPVNPSAADQTFSLHLGVLLVISFIVALAGIVSALMGL